MTTRDWLERHTADAPPLLRARVHEWAAGAGDGTPLPGRLAAAGRRALLHVVSARSAGRQVALDLLAADALVTLALLAQAEEDPSRLAAFADSLLRQGAATP